MSIQLQTVGIIVHDMAETLAFYRLLGLPIPAGAEDEPNFDFEAGGGVTMGFLTAAMAAQADPTYQPAVGGQSLNLQFGCDAPATVDATFARLTAAGAPVHTAPWDAFWGQRFARVLDPDGRIVNLYATL